MYGSIIWYDVDPDGLWDPDEYKRLVLDNSAPLDIPKPRKLGNAFRTGTKAYSRRDDTEFTKVEFYFEDDGRDPKKVSRTLYMRKTRENSSTIHVVGQLIWHHDREEMEHREGNWGTETHILKAKEWVEEYMAEHGGKLTPNAVRENLRDAIFNRLHGFKAKASGSVFFVPLAYTEELQRVAEVHNNISGLRLYINEIMTPEAATKCFLYESTMEWLREESVAIQERCEMIRKGDIDAKFIFDTEKLIEQIKDRDYLYNIIPGVSNQIMEEAMLCEALFTEARDADDEQ